MSPKRFTLVLLPIITFFWYFFSYVIPLFNLWTVGIFIVLQIIFGLVLESSSKRFYFAERHYDGQMTIISKPDGHHLFSLEIDDDPYKLVEKDCVIFKVEALEE